MLTRDQHEDYLRLMHSCEPSNECRGEETIREIYSTLGLKLRRVEWVDSLKSAYVREVYKRDYYVDDFLQPVRQWDSALTTRTAGRRNPNGVALHCAVSVMANAFHSLSSGRWVAYNTIPNLIAKNNHPFYRALAEETTCVIALMEAVFLVRRPIKAKRNAAGLPHCLDGPAIVYRDGTEVYAVDGFPVIKEWVMKEIPVNSLRPLLMGRLPNGHYQQILFALFGFPRLMYCFGKRMHYDDTGVLWRVNIESFDEARFVQVVNSTRRPDGGADTYYLRVPPDIDRACDAVGWTFGMTGKEYTQGLLRQS